MGVLGTQCQQGVFSEPRNLSAQAQAHPRADLFLGAAPSPAVPAPALSHNSPLLDSQETFRAQSARALRGCEAPPPACLEENPKAQSWLWSRPGLSIGVFPDLFLLPLQVQPWVTFWQPQLLLFR